MKKLVLLASLAGAFAATPALACPGHDDAAKSAKNDKPGKPITLVGTVSREGCPMEAKDMDCTGCVLTLATGKDGKTRYMIVKDDSAEKMLKSVLGDKKASEARVEIKGEVFEKDGKMLVRVKTYKVVATA